jgi:hypothetical protein
MRSGQQYKDRAGRLHASFRAKRTSYAGTSLRHPSLTGAAQAGHFDSMSYGARQSTSAARPGGGAFTSDPGRVDIAAFTRQADAAYDLLRDQPQANPLAMLIIGHSEGGLTAMLVDESVWPHPAGVALLEPQDLRPLDLVKIQLPEQLDAAVAAGQITAATAARNEAGIDQVISEFRARAADSHQRPAAADRRASSSSLVPIPRR